LLLIPLRRSSRQGRRAAPPRLLDRLRDALRLRHYALRTEQAYVDWSRRYILFHGKCHPAALGADAVAAFLTHLAVVADGDEARTLRPLQAAAITYRIAFGLRAGQKVLTLRGAVSRGSTARQPLCADIDGFSLHAAVRVEAHDRKRLEQLCRYITRPALSDERLQLMVMSPLEFMQRLAALVPRPRLHLISLVSA